MSAVCVCQIADVLPAVSAMAEAFGPAGLTGLFCTGASFEKVYGTLIIPQLFKENVL